MSKLNQMLDEVKAELQDRVIQSIRDDILGKKNHGSETPESEYPQFSVTATVVCIHPKVDPLKEPLVLVSKRSAECDTFPGKWCFPGGFLEPGETIQACAARELKEELGMKVPSLSDLQVVDVFSAPGHDPRGQIVNIVFVWQIQEVSSANTVKGPEVSDVIWRTPEEIEDIDMAFNHDDIARKLKRGKS